MQQLYLLVPLAPLAGAIIAGLFGRSIGRAGSHWVTILSVAVSFAASCVVFFDTVNGNLYNGPVYTWLTSGGTSFQIGFLIDRLSALMMVVVSFVSLMVHVYTIGYMADDPGYQRFFAYISLFTFSMLMLVMANNFIQLFFGWEAVGLVSYLLIGFWYTRPTAIYANLKAFLVNRVGDFGFLMGIALVLAYFGTLDYAAVFSQASAMSGSTIEIFPGTPWALLTVICIGLFVGAMGKSAQFPLHVWLPDSMEGPTPISALIHAATMVTAGIFMVARMSPLFELSDTARSFVLVIGGITAFFMALVALVQYDIKRVIAYSTLSQLGYMTVALGASAYGVAIFHLMTHAFFKAVLFLGAGSVIVALHHEQDMRKMGGLRKYMPITYATMLIGALANAGFPPFAGFFSKDTIIEAVHATHTAGAGFAYLATLFGVFIGALYSFRLIFYTFHGKERFDTGGHGHAGHGHGGQGHAPRETAAVITVPLILLAIPSIASGWVIGWVVFGDYFGTAIAVAAEHEWIAEMAHEFHGVWNMMAHGLTALPFWFAVAGLATAWYLYIARPDLPAVVREKAGLLTTILEHKYGFDEFNQWFFANGAVKVGTGLWKFGDATLIDGIMVNGSAKLVGWFGGVVRELQSGRIYHYAFSMILGVFVLLTLFGMLAAAG
ncbi:MAG: NADH-quinone oxidoreductase subunit L [Betaproteobacteria bacterium RIFCSPLOWO2_12_FULL_65_110]|nr:MAG: NADH-quinone oxidoreductase subunit L [Betaproteobacteria bacterium RIFCSPLOWO2_12_61_14]OGA36746.1 MAG: NADH-quinone oxidoreductase subunit L [Betaproteobacteria bacterium RIFCSPLOWO2_12_FULL_65_110]